MTPVNVLFLNDSRMSHGTRTSISSVPTTDGLKSQVVRSCVFFIINFIMCLVELVGKFFRRESVRFIRFLFYFPVLWSQCFGFRTRWTMVVGRGQRVTVENGSRRNKSGVSGTGGSHCKEIKRRPEVLGHRTGRGNKNERNGVVRMTSV